MRINPESGGYIVVEPGRDANHLRIGATAEELDGGPADATRSEVIALRDALTEWIGDEGLRCPDCSCQCATSTRAAGRATLHHVRRAFRE